MKGLGARYRNMFTSDILQEARNFIAEAHHSKKIHEDMLKRQDNDEEYVDVYTWTPPCQDLSAAGKQAGFNGVRKTGKLVKKSMSFIKRRRPRLSIMENVPRILAKKFRPHLVGIQRAFKKIGYRVWSKVVNCSKCKVPQSRKRFFMVAIRKDSLRTKFKWPKDCPPVLAEDVLDPFNAETDVPGRLPKNERSKELVKLACNDAFKKTKTDARRVPVLIDVDCSLRYKTYGINRAKTITRARGGSGGPWVSSRGRRATTNELLKLQGFVPSQVPWEAAGLSKRQIGQMIGNSVPPPVMAMVLSESMFAAGLTANKLVWSPGV